LFWPSLISRFAAFAKAPACHREIISGRSLMYCRKNRPKVTHESGFAALYRQMVETLKRRDSGIARLRFELQRGRRELSGLHGLWL
jgi:hypothetical protein